MYVMKQANWQHTEMSKGSREWKFLSVTPLTQQGAEAYIKVKEIS